MSGIIATVGFGGDESLSQSAAESCAGRCSYAVTLQSKDSCQRESSDAMHLNSTFVELGWCFRMGVELKASRLSCILLQTREAWFVDEVWRTTLRQTRLQTRH